MTETFIVRNARILGGDPRDLGVGGHLQDGHGVHERDVEPAVFEADQSGVAALAVARRPRDRRRDRVDGAGVERREHLRGGARGHVGPVAADELAKRPKADPAWVLG